MAYYRQLGINSSGRSEYPGFPRPIGCPYFTSNYIRDNYSVPHPTTQADSQKLFLFNTRAPVEAGSIIKHPGPLKTPTQPAILMHSYMNKKKNMQTPKTNPKSQGNRPRPLQQKQNKKTKEKRNEQKQICVHGPWHRITGGDQLSRPVWREARSIE